METGISKFVYWAPRILAILFILFLSLFSADVVGMQAGFWPTILGLLIHNIPGLILLAVLLVAWKHEIVGAIVFILAGFAYVIMLSLNQFEWYMLAWVLTIAGPAWLTGILFYINWSKKRKMKRQAPGEKMLMI